MTEPPRMNREPIIVRVLRDVDLARGRHIHTVSHSYDEMCQGGDPECPLWYIQLIEAVETWSGS